MANFNTHLSVGFVSSATVAMVAYKVGIIDSTMLALCALCGTIGSLLPDIDLEHSKPVRIGFNVISIIMAFWVVITWGKNYSLPIMLLMWSGVFVVMRYGVLYGYSKSTVHRGVVHSIPYMAILAALTLHILYRGLAMSDVDSWLLGSFVFFGGLVHLILDEIYSVNVLNLKVKRSFGTALKIFEFDKWYFYVIMYVLLAALIITAPPPYKAWEIVSQSVTWAALL